MAATMKATMDPCLCNWCQRRIHYGFICHRSGDQIKGHRWQHKMTKQNLCNAEYIRLSSDERDRYLLKDQRHISSEGLASWKAITAQGENQATWKEAGKALRLRKQQARWVSSLKQVLWHWSQPVAYSFVCGMYFCDLDETQRLLAAVVAVRELLYWISTVIAVLLCPGFLLLELGSPFSLQKRAELVTEAPDGTCRALWTWMKAVHVDKAELYHWVLYIFAPHYYVTYCLSARLDTGKVSLVELSEALSELSWDDRQRDWVLGVIVKFIGFFEIIADTCGCYALYELMHHDDAPGALGFGYWLTVCGFVVGAGSLWLSIVWASFNSRFNSRLWQRNKRVNGRKTAAVVLTLYVPVLTLPLLSGLYVLFRAPLQLTFGTVGAITEDDEVFNSMMIIALVITAIWALVIVVIILIDKCAGCFARLCS